MSLAPDATLSISTQHAIADFYGLGEPERAAFVARGAMGSVDRLTTVREGARRHWAVKRSFSQHYSEQSIAEEVRFTERCTAAGVLAPGSVKGPGHGHFVMTMDDQGDGDIQYRVLEWVEGSTGQNDDPETILAMARAMACIHRLAVDPAGKPVDPWFIMVDYDWAGLAGRLEDRLPDAAAFMRRQGDDLAELTRLVNTTPHDSAIWCHADIGSDNMVRGADGPYVIDWENAGPLDPQQELGMWVRSLGSSGPAAYAAYQEAGGPAEITDVTHLVTSVAVHLNYLGCQAECLLDDAQREHHAFARTQVTNAVNGFPTLPVLLRWIADLRA